MLIQQKTCQAGISGGTGSPFHIRGRVEAPLRRSETTMAIS